MAKLLIISWRDGSIDYTGWQSHSKVEAKRRLRKSLNASPKQMRDIFRKIRNRETVTLDGVPEPKLESLSQILHTMGANLKVELDE